MKRKVLILIFTLIYPVVGYYGISYLKHIYEKIEKSPRTKTKKGDIAWQRFKISYYDRWYVEENNEVLKITSKDEPKAYIMYTLKKPSLKFMDNPTPENLFLETYVHLGVNYEAVFLSKELPSVPWELRVYVVNVGRSNNKFVAWKTAFYMDENIVLVYAQFPYQTSLHKKLSSELDAIHNSFRLNK